MSVVDRFFRPSAHRVSGNGALGFPLCTNLKTKAVS